MQIDQPMTIYTASELKPLLLEAVQASPTPLSSTSANVSGIRFRRPAIIDAGNAVKQPG